MILSAQFSHLNAPHECAAENLAVAHGALLVRGPVRHVRSSQPVQPVRPESAPPRADARAVRYRTWLAVSSALAPRQYGNHIRADLLAWARCANLHRGGSAA
jgi:hypothetical protein